MRSTRRQSREREGTNTTNREAEADDLRRSGKIVLELDSGRQFFSFSRLPPSHTTTFVQSSLRCTNLFSFVVVSLSFCLPVLLLHLSCILLSSFTDCTLGTPCLLTHPMHTALDIHCYSLRRGQQMTLYPPLLLQRVHCTDDAHSLF